jgi:hypothetical protein
VINKIEEGKEQPGRKKGESREHPSRRVGEQGSTR